MILLGLHRNRILKITVLNTVVLLLSVLLLAGIGGCINKSDNKKNKDPVASEFKTLIGEWSGSVEIADGGQSKFTPVKLTIKQAAESSILFYGPDRNCKNLAVYVHYKNDEYYFRFKSAPGGGMWCDKLTNGEMTLRLKDKSALDMNVKHDKYSIDESVELEKKQ